MTTILGAAASGLAYNQQLVDVVGNNVANINTAAFKRSRIFSEGAPASAQEPGAPSMGVALTTVDVIPSVGAAFRDGEPLHFAIQDDTYFRVHAADDSIVYTRLGALDIDGAGNITAPGGMSLEPPVSLPDGLTEPAIDPSGNITALDAQGARTSLGQITLVRFVNPRGLEEIGGGLYRESGNSGATIDGTPGSDGFQSLITGALEGSNVDLAEEFSNLIVAQRAYQASAKTFSIGDEMLSIATNLTR